MTSQISFAAPDSLLAHLLFLGKSPIGTDFPWEHVSAAELPPHLGEELHHARNFSETMHGAALLYNLMLAEEKELKDPSREYEESLGAWWETLKQRSGELEEWNRPRFWALLAEWRTRVPPPSHSFVETWLSAIGTARRIEDIISDRGLRNLIRGRERFLKRARARLGNPQALDRWNGRSGAGQLDYRWGRPVRQMLIDLMGSATGQSDA